MIVEIVGAYVDGRPIPSSSNFFTKEASVYLDAALVYRSVAVMLLFNNLSFTFNAGNIPSCSSSSSSLPSKYTFKKPSNLITSPEA